MSKVTKHGRTSVIRVILRETDIGAAANVGGPVNVSYHTIDVDLPEVEAWLCVQQQWATRDLVGIELLPLHKNDLLKLTNHD